MRIGILLIFCVLSSSTVLAQAIPNTSPGIITGNLLDDKKNPIQGATVELNLFADSIHNKISLTDKSGDFSFVQIRFGWYRLKITYIGFQPLIIDSIHVRAERFDFNLNDITLSQIGADQLKEVIVYAEKPLIQSKEGNITFNVGESALSSGSNANELLKNVPLVATDADGKLTVKGKEPKILIDDKPVELNAQQLQDFLESLPGSMIERIEVMTNPPPQYANEPGGVINIVTRKGKVGIGGRLNVSAGTTGRYNANGNINYRKKGLAINFSAGLNFGQFEGGGYSKRENLYTDSTSYFNTKSQYDNRNAQPNARLAIDYDVTPNDIFNVVLQFNQNHFKNRSETEYMNMNRDKEIYKLSKRYIKTEGGNTNPDIGVTYTHKGKKPGEILRVIAGANYSNNENDRHFFQEFLNADYTANGIDSTQQQLTDSKNHGYYVRVGYDKLLKNKRTSFSTGGAYNNSVSHVIVNAQFLKKPEDIFVANDLLSNDFVFKQGLSNLRFSLRQILATGMSITAGTSVELTDIRFKLYLDKKQVSNNYVTWLPFANFNKNWKEFLNLTLSYRKTIRRPGILQLNPSIDYGDPYNLRFGNPDLQPSTSHNFDLVLGRTKPKYYLNLGFGYNLVKNVFSQIRTLQPGAKTQITWQNIDDRHEYEISTWSGFTFSKKLRVNFSAGYTKNNYSLYDRTVNRYRNGGSFTSNLNAIYAPKDILNFNTSVTFNRFANPQGTMRSNVSMNIGVQHRFLNKRLIVTLNAIDPFIQQKNRVFTYGSNFNIESYNTIQTRNFRLTLAYVFTQSSGNAKKAQKQKENLKKIMQKK